MDSHSTYGSVKGTQLLLCTDGATTFEGLLSPEKLASLFSTTSSVAFREELTAKQASEIYHETLMALYAKQEALSPMNNEFKDQKNIAKQLFDLASLSHALFTDVEGAFVSQKLRQLSLREEGDVIMAYHSIIIPMLNEVHSRDNDADGFAFDISFHHEFESSDRTFFERYECKADTIEWATEERELNMLRYVQRTKLEAHIAEAQHLRFRILGQRVRSEAIRRENTNKRRRMRIKKMQDDLPAITDKWDKAYEVYIRTMSEVKQHQLNSRRKKLEFRDIMRSFKETEKECLSEAKFALELASLKGPFEFLKLPREIRDMIYGLLLSFDYTVSLKSLEPCNECEPTDSNYFGPYRAKKCGCWRNHLAILWTHPLFHTSKTLREEASEQFYMHNSFGSPSFSTLPTRKLSPRFYSLIQDLSITWPSLGSISVQVLQMLKKLTGLRFLKIYLNWEQLSTRHRNSLDGVAAFEFILDHLPIEVRSLEKLEIFEVGLTRKERRLKDLILEEGQISESVDNLFYNNVYSYEQFVVADGYKGSIMARVLEEDYDRALNSRLINARTPGTVYSNGQLPKKPSSFRKEMNSKKARRNKRKGLQDALAIQLVERSVAKEKLAEIRRVVIEQRERHIAVVAAEKERRVRLREEQRQDEMMVAIDVPLPADESTDYDIDYATNNPDYEMLSRHTIHPTIRVVIKDTVGNIESFWSSFDSYF